MAEMLKPCFWMDVLVVFCLDVAYVESRDICRICRMMGSNKMV